MKNNRINVAFLAFLAWMAALMVVVMLMSSCSTSNSQFTRSYDGSIVKKHSDACAAYQ